MCRTSQPKPGEHNHERAAEKEHMKQDYALILIRLVWKCSATTQCGASISMSLPNETKHQVIRPYKKGKWETLEVSEI